MKITDVKTTIVSVPLKLVESAQSLTSRTLRVTTGILVEVATDEDIIGIGEAPDVLGSGVTKLIIDSARAKIVGEDPLQIEPLMKRLFGHYNLTHLHPHAGSWALAGIEMALWDILGKACGKPLYQLWGGAFRKDIPFYGSLERTTPADIARQAKELVERGFRTLYLKVGMGFEEDLACVRAIREAVGPSLDIKIRVDANQSWAPGEAIAIINRLAEFGLEFVDQPVLMHDLEGLARVRDAVSVSIASHESSWTFYDVLKVVKSNAADIIHIDPRFDAGFTGARKGAAIAEAAGIPVVHHSFGELGVALASFMHLIASSPNFLYANQQGYDILSDDVLKGGKMEFRAGCLRLPEGPGIGVELDPERVAKYARYHAEQVQPREFDSPMLSDRYMLMSFRRYLGY